MGYPQIHSYFAHQEWKPAAFGEIKQDLPYLQNENTQSHEGDSPKGDNSVTVIIVNWNGGDLLSKCFKHLAAQTVQPDSILLIDNSSTDGSEAAAEAFPQITTHKMKENFGFAEGNNVGLLNSCTEFVALLNPDAFSDPDWLERLLAAARQRPDISVFGSRQLIHGSDGILDGIGDQYHISGLVWRHRHGRRQQEVDLTPREIFSPCACAAMYRRQAVLDAGGFDRDYFCYTEDVDLGFRLRLAGHGAMYVPDAVVHHVGSASTGGQRSDFAVYHGHRNLVWTFVKNMPGILFWLSLPLHLLLNIATIGVFILRGQGKAICRAKWDALKGLPAAWSKRKKIQAARKAKIRAIWRVLDKSLIVRK